MRQITTCISHLSLKAIIGLCLLTITACKKEVEPQPINQAACLITKSEDQLTGAFTTLQYDEKNRLISYFTHRPKNDFFDEQNITCTVERNQANQITKVLEEYDNGQSYNFAFEYDSKGRWSKTTASYPSSGLVDLIRIPEYDAENRISKVTKTKPDGSTSEITTYQYTDGNMTKVTYASTNYENTILYEHDLTRKQLTLDQDINRIYRYASGGNSGSKNIVTKSIPVGSVNKHYEYLNEYNDKGYPTKHTARAISSDGTSTIIDVRMTTYQCQ
jgi:hypothetical protein